MWTRPERDCDNWSISVQGWKQAQRFMYSHIFFLAVYAVISLSVVLTLHAPRKTVDICASLPNSPQCEVTSDNRSGCSSDITEAIVAFRSSFYNSNGIVLSSSHRLFFLPPHPIGVFPVQRRHVIPSGDTPAMLSEETCSEKLIWRKRKTTRILFSPFAKNI